jgi:hypothetical protein
LTHKREQSPLIKVIFASELTVSLNIIQETKMKYFYTIILVFIIALSFLKAQIPNAGFENWANDDPVDWFTYDFLGNAVTQTSESHSGSSAAKLEIIDFMGSAIPPVLFSGEIGVSTQIGSLTGYFKFAPIDVNQSISVVILLSKGSNYIGGGVWETYQASSTYSQFVVPINYATGEIPDTAYIQIAVSDSSGSETGGIGAFAIVDDLSFGGPTGVSPNQVTLNTFKLEQNYPNPFNPSTTISFSIPNEEFVSLKVFNSLGEEVAELLNEEKPAGNYSLPFDASLLSSGVYFYKISAGSFVETRKMILLR